ncbi:hypothetical protein D3C79_1056990 [compost metagenome]
MSGTAHRSAFVEVIKAKEIKVIRKENGAVHLDGEPKMLNGQIDIKIRPLSLKVLVPSL